MTPYRLGLPQVDDSWGVLHAYADRPDHVRIGYHAYWRLEFTVNATSQREAEERVLAYADTNLYDDLRQGFARGIVGMGMSTEVPQARWSVDLYILDRDWIPEDICDEQRNGLTFGLPVYIP